MKAKILITLMALAPALASAQTDLGVWAGAEAQFKLSKKWSAEVGADVRTNSGFSSFNRWSLGAEIDFAPVKVLEFGVGYAFQDQHKDSYATKKGNIVDDYWRIRNRVYGQAKLKFRPSVLKLDFRFRYQMTSKAEVSIAKYSSSGTRKDNEVKEAETENLFRSRVGFGVKTKSIFTPSVSYELFNNLGDSFSLDKQRLCVGTDIKLSKRNSIYVGYVRNIFSDDNDDDNMHNAIQIGYKIKF